MGNLLKGPLDNALYIKIADGYCKIIIEDIAVLSYLKKEYFLLKGPYATPHWVKIRKTESAYHFSCKGIQYRIRIEKIENFKHIDFLIMVFIAYQAIDDGVLFLHASSLVINDLGYVFFGRAGIGKSTIIKSVPKPHVYSDDTAVIKKIKKTFYIFPSPFDRKHVDVHSKNPVRIDKLFFLSQSKTNIEKNISFMFKLYLLSKNDIYFFTDRWLFSHKNPSKKSSLYNLIVKLINNVSIKKLSFNKMYDPLCLRRN